MWPVPSGELSSTTRIRCPSGAACASTGRTARTSGSTFSTSLYVGRMSHAGPGTSAVTYPPPTVADPTNSQIAAAFDELGDLYELDGAIVHRVVAYRNAAKAVRDSTVSVAALTREGKVTELPGIGKTLEEKINALMETGDIPSSVKLRAKYPIGLIAMTHLPGLGPKRARRLYDELGIESLDALRAAAEEERIRALRGFAAKAEEAILESLDALASGEGQVRVLLDRALAIGDALVDSLRAHPGSDRVELAGSARRMADTVKDLDIIATAHDPLAVAQALA